MHNLSVVNENPNYLQGMPGPITGGISPHMEQVCDIKGDTELLARFLAEYNEKTQTEYRKILKDFSSFINRMNAANPLLKIYSLHQVGFGIMQEYKYYLTTYQKKDGTNLSNATIALRLRVISSLYSFGIKIGYFKTNPVLAISKPKPKGFIHDKFLSEDEVMLILEGLKESSLNDSINYRNYLIGLTLFYLGLRINELCSIRWNDFFKNPKGIIGLEVHQKGGGTRVVKIREDLWGHICKYRELTGHSSQISKFDTSPLYINHSGKALDTSYIRKLLKKVCKQKGIEKNVTPHWFRHTSASYALALGADIQSVKAQFGWTNLNTPNRYLHSVKGLDDTATDVMPSLNKI